MKMSRNRIMDAVEMYRDEFIEMSTDRKRRLYFCGTEFKMLSQIPTLYDEKSVGQQSEMSDETRDLMKRVSVWSGDITMLEIDAIVNPTNNKMQHAGGVDKAIHQDAGGLLRLETEKIGGCATGEVKLTAGYVLPAKYVVHTVAPRGEHLELLRSCYLNSLELAKENKIKSIAFPCISTGVNGYTLEEAAEVALGTVKAWLIENPHDIERVIFCVYLCKHEEAYAKVLPKYFP